MGPNCSTRRGNVELGDSCLDAFQNSAIVVPTLEVDHRCDLRLRGFVPASRGRGARGPGTLSAGDRRRSEPAPLMSDARVAKMDQLVNSGITSRTNASICDR